MNRIKLIVEYNGANYFGWQSQKDKNTIQDKIEAALKVLFKKDIRIVAAGRTDSGVHAKGQVVHFDIPEYDLYRLKRSLNGLLDDDIAVKGIKIVSGGFHARFDAKSRKYRYYISQEVTALFRMYSWSIYEPLNLTLLQDSAQHLIKFTDFQAFCKPKSAVNNYVCKIFESNWSFENDLLVYTVTANRFLHGMVRAMVGTLISVGKGDTSLAQIDEILGQKDRTNVPLTAPARGLFLEQVTY